ncbi:hypothetical protein CYMTET_19511 [Cymbomonas tetramitiformis]|uniref:RNA-dependent RNA polymerase n=1 Tax=Cymbomonas tetramitiformis TaxID=36881 RepID=A0AAE0L580_9CHLO|nr:hypothetical protein CYMTET_19511 [Cymbomonas tetramitiformis]
MTIQNSEHNVELDLRFRGAVSKPETDAVAVVKRIDVFDVSVRLTYSVNKLQTNRLFHYYGADHFAVIHFQVGFGSRKAACEYVAQVLRNGIKIDNQKYSYLGHSASQLKSATCVLFCGTPEAVTDLIEEWGAFSRISEVAKRAKRFGLLLSGIYPILKIGAPSVQMIDDIQTSEYVFTDGCGFVSPAWAKKIARRANAVCRFRGQPYVPSVLQIRYKGFKGILVVHPDVVECDVQIAFKYLMAHNELDIAEKLWEDGINGVVHTRLLKLQAAEIRSSAKCVPKRGSSGQVQSPLSTPSSSPCAEAALSSPGSHSDVKEKLRIRIEDSRLAFGVADPSGLLEYGQCFYQPTIDGEPRALTDGFVLVARNPAYHPGDLRVLQVVDVPSCRHLRDVIVFRTKGPRPHADEMAGGDLDGDKFFCCWDSDLVPCRDNLVPPLEYPAAPPRVTPDHVTREDLIRYFAYYDAALVGKLDAYWNTWADLKGVNCRECTAVAQLFARGVDACTSGERVAVPSWLVPPTPPHQPTTGTLEEEASSSAEQRAWNKMDLAAQLWRRSNNLQVLSDSLGGRSSGGPPGQASRAGGAMDIEEVQRLLELQDVGVSDYELLRFIIKWCKRHSCSLIESGLMYAIDYSTLSHEQRLFAKAAGVPVHLLYNALNASEIISREDLAHFSLHSVDPLHWKLFSRGSLDIPATYGSLYTCLTGSQADSMSLKIGGAHLRLNHYDTAIINYLVILHCQVHRRSRSRPAQKERRTPALNSSHANADIDLTALNAIGHVPGRWRGCDFVLGFEKKLVVFRTHESQAVAVYFPHRCDGPGEHACTGTEQLVAYVFARGFRKKEVLVDHQFDFDSVRLQLYRGQKRSSFLWLRAAPPPPE